jgi:hypothetical protein
MRSAVVPRCIGSPRPEDFVDMPRVVIILEIGDVVLYEGIYPIFSLVLVGATGISHCGFYRVGPGA